MLADHSRGSPGGAAAVCWSRPSPSAQRDCRRPPRSAAPDPRQDGPSRWHPRNPYGGAGRRRSLHRKGRRQRRNVRARKRRQHVHDHGHEHGAGPTSAGTVTVVDQLPAGIVLGGQLKNRRRRPRAGWKCKGRCPAPHRRRMLDRRKRSQKARPTHRSSCTCTSCPRRPTRPTNVADREWRRRGARGNHLPQRRRRNDGHASGAVRDQELHHETSSEPNARRALHPGGRPPVRGHDRNRAQLHHQTTHEGRLAPAGGAAKEVQVELPPGFVGNPQNAPQCPLARSRSKEARVRRTRPWATPTCSLRGGTSGRRNRWWQSRTSSGRRRDADPAAWSITCSPPLGIRRRSASSSPTACRSCSKRRCAATEITVSPSATALSEKSRWRHEVTFCENGAGEDRSGRTSPATRHRRLQAVPDEPDRVLLRAAGHDRNARTRGMNRRITCQRRSIRDAPGARRTERENRS